MKKTVVGKVFKKILGKNVWEFILHKICSNNLMVVTQI